MTDPFTHVQLDLAGPYFAFDLQKNSRKKCKIWCAVFVCQASGACNLEICADSSAQSVLKAIETMSLRYGKIRSLSCDPATSFKAVGSLKEDVLGEPGARGKSEAVVENLEDQLLLTEKNETYYEIYSWLRIIFIRRC